MAWLELHQTLPMNKKTLRLKSLLKIKTPQAVGHLCMLWLWALDNASDGDLSEFTVKEISEVSDWTGDAQKFVDSLIGAGFIDADMHLHDWDDYAGKLLEQRIIQREQSRIRQQKRRDKLKENNADVTRDKTVSNAGITRSPYPTVPNITNKREIDIRAREVFDLYEKVSGAFTPEPLGKEIIFRINTGTDIKLIEEAIRLCVGKGNPAAYFSRLMQNWSGEGIKTYEDYLKKYQPDTGGGRAKAVKPGPSKKTFSELVEDMKKEGRI